MLAVFDVDGVLIDSLDAHLKICEDLNRQYHLGLRIPGPAEFRSLIQKGTPVSPMRQLFVAVGFPPDAADRADQFYKENFRKLYPMKPFPDVAQLLLRLRRAGKTMGLVTSNL